MTLLNDSKNTNALQVLICGTLKELPAVKDLIVLRKRDFDSQLAIGAGKLIMPFTDFGLRPGYPAIFP